MVQHCITAFSVLFMVTVPARAGGEPGRAAPSGKTVVMVAPTTEATKLKELGQAVKSQLVDTPATLRTALHNNFPKDLSGRLAVAREAAKKHRAVAVFWYEQPGPGEHYLFVFDPAGGRLLVRIVNPAASGGGTETVANIVRASVQALLKGGQIGVRMPAPRPTARPPPPRPPEPVLFTRPKAKHVPARRWLGVELGYAYQAYATEQPALNGMWAGLAVHLHRNWSVYTGYHLYQTVTISGAFAFSKFRRHPVTAGARFRWPVGRWEVGCSASVLLDYVTHNTREAEPAGEMGVSSSGKKGDLIVAGSALFRFGFRIVDRLRLVGRVGAEFGFNNKRYVVKGEQFGETLLTPWPVRPRLEVGLEADLF
jgi:hypothetical protein